MTHEPEEAGWPDPDAWYATRKEREAAGPDPEPPDDGPDAWTPQPPDELESLLRTGWRPPPPDEPDEANEDGPGGPDDGPEPDWEDRAQQAADDAYDRYGRALEWGGEPGP